MASEHDELMRVALEEAARSRDEGNLGVGSLIVRGGEVVARGRNLVTSVLDPTAHAETVAIREAGKALGQVDLSDCTLYTTFQPCPMCCGAIMLCGISTLVIGARPAPSENRWGEYTVERLLELANWGHRIQVVTGVLSRECEEVRY